MHMTRKAFLQTMGSVALGATVAGPAVAAPAEKAKVYFSPVIDAEHLIALYRKISGNITGKVAIKLHTGEKNGPNILPRDMVRAFQTRV